MSREKILETILVICTGLLVFYLIFDQPMLIWIAVSIGVGSLLIPVFGRGLTWAWYKLAAGLGYVNTRILLSLVFFVFLVPVAFLARLFSKDSLQLKKKEGKQESYYHDRNHEYSKKDLENVF